MTDTTTPKEEILPKHSNGTTQRMHHYEMEDKSLDAIADFSAVCAVDTANSELDPYVSKVTQGHVTNCLAAKKTEASIIRMYDKVKNPNAKLALARLLGAKTRELLALEAPSKS